MLKLRFPLLDYQASFTSTVHSSHNFSKNLLNLHMGSMVLCSKVVLISAGVVSLAVGVYFYMPFLMEEAPAVWTLFLSWLKPPYLYVLINAIIFVIIASSRLHQSSSEPSSSARSEHLISVKTPPSSYYDSVTTRPEIAAVVEDSIATAAAVYADEDGIVEVKPVSVNSYKAVAEDEDEELFARSVPTGDFPFEKIVYPEVQPELLSPVREKPLISSRFGHRKPIRTNNPEQGMRALRVARPKRVETLESTWKTITEGRHVPLNRHLKKSDTWEHHVTSAAGDADHVLKSETFNGRSSLTVSRIRKEPSLGQDDLNRRVEAFIKKINEDMRMQRQESLNQYKEMMRRGL